MLPKNEDDLEQLARQYFIEELGLPPELVPDAARNLTSAFEVLLRINERVEKSKITETI